MNQYRKAKKSLGQNFLIDGRIADQIVDSVDGTRGRSVVEIGPGHGALTEKLLDRGFSVIAIEFDRELCRELKERFGAHSGFSLIESDVLAVDFCSLVDDGESASVVANLPYNISTPVLQRLIDSRRCLSGMVLMLQREVVDRIAAPARNSERGYLSVLVQAHCTVEKITDVAPQAFRPVPGVWSTVARFEFDEKIDFVPDEESLFVNIVSTCFSQKRKTILNNLRQAAPGIRSLLESKGGALQLLNGAGIEPRSRAEELEMIDWERLLKGISPVEDVV